MNKELVNQFTIEDRYNLSLDEIKEIAIKYAKEEHYYEFEDLEYDLSLGKIKEIAIRNIKKYKFEDLEIDSNPIQKGDYLSYTIKVYGKILPEFE